jgi:hypothetical protein
MTNAVLNPTRQQRHTLVMVKLLHTAVWAFLAGCIVALPAAAWLRRFDWAATLTAIILGCHPDRHHFDRVCSAWPQWRALPFDRR